jgi:hypothetical protein
LSVGVVVGLIVGGDHVGLNVGCVHVGLNVGFCVVAPRLCFLDRACWMQIPSL